MTQYTNPILYENTDNSVFVLDIPASIAAAQLPSPPSQARPGVRFDRHNSSFLAAAPIYLVSCPPPKKPFKTPDPGTQKPKSSEGKRSNRENYNNFERDDDELHKKYLDLIFKALEEVKAEYVGVLCLERKCGGIGGKGGGRLENGGRAEEGEWKVEGENGHGRRVTGGGMVEEKDGLDGFGNLGKMLEHLCESNISARNRYTFRANIILCEDAAAFPNIEEKKQQQRQSQEHEGSLQWEGFHHNPHYQAQHISITRTNDSHQDTDKTTSHRNDSNVHPANTFFIPPQSTFLMDTCNNVASFHALVRNVFSSSPLYENSRPQFDVIVLDPPWPNASAKRKHKKEQGRKRKREREREGRESTERGAMERSGNAIGNEGGREGEGKGSGETNRDIVKNNYSNDGGSSSYNTLSTLRSIRALLLGMDLDRLITPGTIFGIWITNKPSIRNFVLGPGGLFARLGIKFIEEWVWIKITTGGEPVTPLQGTWRRPYEVFLVGRALEETSVGTVEGHEVKCTVIFAVPDLHSRKPCLKGLLEGMVERLRAEDDGEENENRQQPIRALEVFARNLVAGWWSWGDQVLMYNWSGSMRLKG